MQLKAILTSKHSKSRTTPTFTPTYAVEFWANPISMNNIFKERNKKIRTCIEGGYAEKARNGLYLAFGVLLPLLNNEKKQQPKNQHTSSPFIDMSWDIS
ncbi:hypothetical protein POPTR_018G012050v4 [Populus trichocarpa]|uniref:Uncharacterized protein n=1 Tax=Populus trichocarpa TaxID=3694 RepID=A0ACC0RMV2_POPTR|nr:hypothetical protein POPTR_018G012050v4 [Populus trichocarpa]